MKTKVFSLLSVILTVLVFSSKAQDTTAKQNNQMPDTTKYVIVDLYTGDTIDVNYDEVKYVTVNRVTGLPVDYYIITNTMDTVQGITGLIVNNALILGTDKKYTLDPLKVNWNGTELKVKEPGKFARWENGRLTIQDGSKYFVQEKNGDVKANDGWTTIKWKGDKLKMEDPTKKVKIKDDKAKTKTKNGGNQ